MAWLISQALMEAYENLHLPLRNDMLKSNIVISNENGKWTRNTDTAHSAIALFAGRLLFQGIRIRSSNVVQTLVAACSKLTKQKKLARFVRLSFCQQGKRYKLAHGNAERFSGYLEKKLIHWLQSEGGLPCFAVALLRDALETKQTGLQRCLAIPLTSFARTLNPILSRGCHGTTTGKVLTHGA